MANCNFCGKELVLDEDCWHIEDCGEDYCYDDIETKEDIYNSCIGKELLNCGYSEDYILNLFSQELEDREPEIYYTTIPE